jgi:hypothetical protein
MKKDAICGLGPARTTDNRRNRLVSGQKRMYFVQYWAWSRTWNYTVRYITESLRFMATMGKSLKADNEAFERQSLYLTKYTMEDMIIAVETYQHIGANMLEEKHMCGSECVLPCNIVPSAIRYGCAAQAETRAKAEDLRRRSTIVFGIMKTRIEATVDAEHLEFMNKLFVVIGHLVKSTRRLVKALATRLPPKTRRTIRPKKYD